MGRPTVMSCLRLSFLFGWPSLSGPGHANLNRALVHILRSLVKLHPLLLS